MRLSSSCRLSFPDMADQIHSVTKLLLLAIAGDTSECYGAYSARLARIVQVAGHVVRSCGPYTSLLKPMRPNLAVLHA